MDYLADSCAVKVQVLQSNSGLFIQSPVGSKTIGIGISLLSVYMPQDMQ